MAERCRTNPILLYFCRWLNGYWKIMRVTAHSKNALLTLSIGKGRRIFSKRWNQFSQVISFSNSLICGLFSVAKSACLLRCTFLLTSWGPPLEDYSIKISEIVVMPMRFLQKVLLLERKPSREWRACKSTLNLLSTEQHFEGTHLVEGGRICVLKSKAVSK